MPQVLVQIWQYGTVLVVRVQYGPTGALVCVPILWYSSPVMQVRVQYGRPKSCPNRTKQNRNKIQLFVLVLVRRAG